MIMIILLLQVIEAVASCTMSLGFGLDHNAMITKIDNYIAKYHTENIFFIHLS